MVPAGEGSQDHRHDVHTRRAQATRPRHTRLRGMYSETFSAALTKRQNKLLYFAIKSQIIAFPGRKKRYFSFYRLQTLLSL